MAAVGGDDGLQGLGPPGEGHDGALVGEHLGAGQTGQDVVVLLDQMGEAIVQHDRSG